MTFDGIAIISIPVMDQARAKAFYVGKLGCQVVEEMPFGKNGVLWIRLALPGMEKQTQLVLATWFPDMKPGTLRGLVLATRDIAAAHATLRKHDVEISDIAEQPWGKEATLRDPDGNGWVLQQSVTA